MFHCLLEGQASVITTDSLQESMDILKAHETEHTVRFSTFYSRKGLGETGGMFTVHVVHLYTDSAHPECSQLVMEKITANLLTKQLQAVEELTRSYFNTQIRT